MGLAARFRSHAEAAVYAVAAIALWPVPLLDRLHAESSAVLALVAWFVAGTVSARRFRTGARPGPVLGGRLTRLLVPLILMLVPALWAPNCDWLRGLLLFGLFPVVTVVLATSTAWALTGLAVRRPVRVLTAIGIAVAILGPLYDIGLHPQFYTYNHVFGGVLGPLYDEDLVMRAGLFWFRGLSLTWALLAWTIGRAGRGRGETRSRSLEGAGVVTALLVLAYVGAGRIGINTTDRVLERAMPRGIPVEGLVLHLPNGVKPERVRRIVSEAGYRYDTLRRRLGSEPDGIVDVWVYPDPETRGRLTGARVTSVAPVWLGTPQVHVLEGQFEDIFAHELVHAFSRTFGLPVLNASISVGLVEGLAVALEPPDGRPSPDEQVAATADSGTADRLARSLTPWGFWGGRGAVSYTTTGSFVAYLCDAYGIERVRDVYADADFEHVYGRSPDDLADEWMKALDERTWLPSDARSTAGSRFAVPSLFERRCPHWVPRAERLRRASVRAWEKEDTLVAARAAERAFQQRPDAPAVLAHALRMRVRTGDLEAARRLAASTPDSLLTANGVVAVADLEALDGSVDAARRRYDEVFRSLRLSSREARVLLSLRLVAAGRPDVLRSVLLPGPVGRRADRLAEAAREATLEGERAATATLRALVLESGRRPSDAAQVLQGVVPASGSLSLGQINAWRLQRFAWLSEWSEAAGDLHAAVAYADSAVSQARDLEDRVAERYWIDQGGRLQYSLEVASNAAPLP